MSVARGILFPPSASCLGGMTHVLWAFALFAIGCATTSEQQKLAEKCRENIEHDERCIEVLTSDHEGYESREEVMAAEERRDAKAFEDRLARLRREEEERQATRARTGTVAEGVDSRRSKVEQEEAEGVDSRRSKVEQEEIEEEISEEAKDLAGAKIQAPGRLEVGSSVRALGAPTPESYLRGSKCVLTDDLQAMRKTFEEGKRKRADIGELAVVILDAEALVGRIDGEMKHRRLPAQDGECKQHGQVIELLRSLVGARVDGRGLVRLTKELELRAGLPKAE